MSREENAVAIHTPAITLAAFLKWVGAAATGGEATALIRRGAARVNGEVELRRGRKLSPGDRIEVEGGGRWRLEAADDCT